MERPNQLFTMVLLTGAVALAAACSATKANHIVHQDEQPRPNPNSKAAPALAQGDQLQLLTDELMRVRRLAPFAVSVPTFNTTVGCITYTVISNPQSHVFLSANYDCAYNENTNGSVPAIRSDLSGREIYVRLTNAVHVVTPAALTFTQTWRGDNVVAGNFTEHRDANLSNLTQDQNQVSTLDVSSTTERRSASANDYNGLDHWTASTTGQWTVTPGDAVVTLRNQSTLNLKYHAGGTQAASNDVNLTLLADGDVGFAVDPSNQNCFRPIGRFFFTSIVNSKLSTGTFHTTLDGIIKADGSFTPWRAHHCLEQTTTSSGNSSGSPSPAPSPSAPPVPPPPVAPASQPQ